MEDWILAKSKNDVAEDGIAFVSGVAMQSMHCEEGDEAT